MFITVLWLSIWIDWYVNYWSRPPVMHLSDTAGTIPAVLFKKGTDEHAHLPNSILELYRTIESDNPGYRVVYLSDSQARHFMMEHCPAYLNAYDTLIPGAYKADLLRLCLLYIYGGVYGDFSQQYLAKLDTLVDRRHNELVLVADANMPVYPNPTMYTGICNGFLASRSHHTFLKCCMDRIVKHVRNRYYGWTPLYPTGPGLLRTILDEHPEIPYRMDVALLGPSGLFKLGTFRKVIQLKMNNHYGLMRASTPHYIKAWFARNIYGSG